MGTTRIKGTISSLGTGHMPTISKVFSIMAVLMWILGIIAGVFYSLVFESILVGSILIVSSIISGCMFFAIGKMLDLLDQIANNTEKMRLNASIVDSYEDSYEDDYDNGYEEV